ADSAALAAQIVRAARAVPALSALATAPNAAGTVTRTLTIIDGRLALLSVAAIEPENDAERLGRTPSEPVDYLATIDILEPSQFASLGAELDLLDFEMTQHPPTDVVSLPLRAANGERLGYVQWLNVHPGGRAFAGQIGPVLLGVIIIGVLS